MADLPPPQLLRIDVGGLSLAADAFGHPADRPVLLLHGGGQTRHSWRSTAEQLAGSGWYAVSADLRGHGDSDWSPDGIYSADLFSADARTLARWFPTPPAMVGASLGGISSLLAIAEADGPVASALVMVDVAPRIEAAGVDRIGNFMRLGLDGFDSLDAVADAVATYNPHRPRPTDLNGLRKNVRQKEDGRWYWHWDPRFMERPTEPGLDGLARERLTPTERLETAARAITVPTLLVRGGASDLLSEEGAKALLALIPHAHFADVAGAGHMVAGDRNDRFNEAVIDFLTGEVAEDVRR